VATELCVVVAAVSHGVARQTGSTEIRADAVASQVNIGRIGLLRGARNAAFLDSLVTAYG
jgi:hypothetical protein